MRIVYLASGAAGMYCGSCLHDNTLAAALLKAGADVLLVPTYTPIRTDEESVSQRRVFLGGVNVYLQQKLAIFRHTPEFVDSLLDSRVVMGWLSRRKATVDASQLGDLTVSMLKGSAGRQAKELKKLTRWLKLQPQPDVVHLSNALLVGMAADVQAATGAPIVCGLAGEDIFLEALREPYYTQARDLLRRHAGDAAAYVALNRYYADYAIKYMDLDPSRVHVIPHGLNLAGHAPVEPGRNYRKTADEPFTLGYFAHVCPAKGFHVLIDAFRILCGDNGLPPLRLRAAGYLSDGDKPFLEEQQRKLAEAGLADRFEYLGEPDRSGKIAILQSLDAMTVPTVYRESKGLSILEALANGVPVVLPAHGAFPEVIDDTGGGLLFEPENASALAEAIRRLMVEPDLLSQLGRLGHAAVHARYHAGEMAARTMQLYREVCESASRLPRDAAPQAAT
ncbi:MAG: glycosyltransferase family 4 protein [Planctomycetia bacterium]|nr:glycosyltransferase family 4 protein [Planctomycetia bacterium]